jgi:2-polyprenyl-3-methyl-5-hydroxy-6-metoxy-1,4-benzoquinol methylase
MCTLHDINTQNAEEFSGKLVDMLNHGALAVMLSIGHRTGLLDTMSELPPANSEEIANAAGLEERYVREWLGAMATGGIVEVHANGGEPRFTLPAEHAAALTRAAGVDNIGVFTQYIGLLGGVEDDVLECFKNGGGVPYSEYSRFHEVMAEDSGQSVLSSLFDAILPLVPGLMEKLEQGIEVLDIGCGMGRAVNLMAETFPSSRFSGYDLSEQAITAARAGAVEHATGNVHFEVRDLTTFDTDAPERQFDLITSFDAIHDQARPDRVLAGIYKALRSDGVYLMQDISASSEVQNNLEHPVAPFLYTVSTMHCMTVSLAQGGMGLGTMWGREKAQEMLRAAGFTQISIHNLSHDFQNDYYVVRK